MYVKDEHTIVEQKPLGDKVTTLVNKDRKVTHAHIERIKVLPNGMTCHIDNPDYIYLP
jgi:hypothetical protein